MTRFLGVDFFGDAKRWSAGCGRPEQQPAWKRILAALDARLGTDATQRALMRRSPDALDAAVAAFGAVAARPAGVPGNPPADGRIAVLDN